MGLFREEKFVLWGQASRFVICQLVKKLGTWRPSRVWENEVNVSSEGEWLWAFDAWLKKVPLGIRQKVHHVIVPSEKLEFRQLSIPVVSKQHYKQAIEFELKHSMRDPDSGASTKWVFDFVDDFIEDKDDGLSCFAAKHSFLERWLKLLARRYVSVRYTFIDSLLPFSFFENARDKEPTLFVYAGAHVTTLCFHEGPQTKMMAIPYDHLSLLKNLRKVAAVHENGSDDLGIVRETLAADLTTALGSCGIQERQQLHSKFKQAELALYREASKTEYHKTVVSAYHPSAYAFIEQVLLDAGKSVTSASEYFKLTWGRRVPETTRDFWNSSLVALCGSVAAKRSRASVCHKDLIPLNWKADYFFSQSKAFILGTVLVVLVLLFGELSILKVGNKHFNTEISALQTFEQEAILMEKAIAEANQQIITKRKDADRIRSLVRHQDAWLKHFNDVRTQVAKAQTLWFDEWEWKPAATSPQIEVKGSMLTSEILGLPSSDQQMAQFLQNIRRVAFVKDVQDIKLSMKDEGLIAFSFNLILNKETPLSL
ncbi:MAG: hypothetical protein LBD40_02510 [Puniceicoccales bacterium]|jgi:hypothetical protein|nr:hypothetical protein [Puniceicoccales bacterium]